MTDIKRTYINANEELVIRGKLTVEGEFEQKDITTVISETQFEGDSLIVNADGGATTAKIVLRSGNTDANISFGANGTIEFDQPISVIGDIEANIIGNVTGNVTGQVSDISNHDTDDLAEGTRLYFTTERARGSVSAAGDLSYNATTGLFSVTTYKSSDFDDDFAGKTTTDLSEGTNLYYTTARVRSNVGVDAQSNLTYDNVSGVFGHALTTDDVTEGDDLYFTTQRARDSISAGTGVFYDAANGVVSIGQDVSTDANVEFHDVLVQGTLTIGGGAAGEWVGNVTGNVTGDLIGNVTGDVTGTVSDISNHDTDSLAEGNTNLYFTFQRVEDYLNGNDGIVFADGNISVDNTVLRTTGNQTVDGDETKFTGDVVVDGNLTVSGNTTVIDVEQLRISDSVITLNSGFTGGNPTENAGIEVERGDLNNVSVLWNEISDRWTFTNNGTDFFVLPVDTDDLSEGDTNLYFTQQRARDSVSASGDLSYNAASGVFSVTTYKSTDFDTDFAAKNTDDLAEGSNLYFTEQRVQNTVDAYVSGGTGIDYANGEVSVDNTVVRTSGDFALSGNIEFDSILKIPTTQTLEERTVYIQGNEVFAYVGGEPRKLTPAVDVGDIETVGATGVEIYAGTRTEEFGNVNVSVAGIRRLEAGNSIIVTEDSNVITVAANIASIQEQFGAEKTAGLGNLTYNNSTGLFSYTGVTSTEIRGLFSNTGLITYNTSTGEIGTTADLYSSWTVETESANTHAVTSGSTLRILGGTNITVENDGANITIRNDNPADITAVIAGTGLTGGGTEGAVTLNVDITEFDTDDIAEGNTNLYYTDVRANSAIDARVDTAYVNALGISASNVVYNNASSAIESVNVQDAITELSDNKLDVTALTGAVTFFATTANSDITNYNRLVTTTSDADFDTTPVDVNTGTFSGANVLIAQLASDTGVLSGNTTSINIVTYGDVRRVTGNENDGAEFFFEVHKRDSDDNETLLATSSTTRTVDQAVYQQFFATALIPDTGFTEDDRVVLKFYGTVTKGSGGRSYSFRFGGDKPVRTLFPVPVNVIVQNIAARNIDVDTGAFDGILTAADIDVQRALESLDQIDTDVVPEGNTNLYYTTTRANSAIADYDGNITTTGTVTVDKLVVNTDTTLNGNITVNGVNTQSIGTETEVIEDYFGENITTANITVTNSLSALCPALFTGDIQANTATFSGAVTGNLTGNVTGQVSSIANHSTTDLAEGTNLYFTQTRVRGNVSAGNGLSYSNATGVFSVSAGNFIIANVTGVHANATSANTPNTLVARDANGSFSANVITATATQSRYADLAENYQADREYDAGTVLIIGGDKEVTVTDVYADTSVAGVVSTDPAHLMNSKLKGHSVVAVALRGRIPVKVIGPVHKGDVLVTSEKAGYACAAKDSQSVPASAIVGKALSSHSASGTGVVEALV